MGKSRAVFWFVLGALFAGVAFFPARRAWRYVRTPPPPAARVGTPDYPFGYRHQGMIRRAKLGGIGVAFLGDSITDGLDDQPWWPQFAAGHRAVDFGIAGDTSGDVLRRLEDYSPLDARVVVLMVGTNDLTGEATPAQVAERVAKILASLRGRRVILCSILWRQDRSVREANAELKKLADGDAVVWLDVHDPFMVRGDLLSDGIHPSPAGYEVWRDALEPLLR